MGSVKEYYKLAKPGIVYGNILTTIAAFLFVWRWNFSELYIYQLFIATVLGLSLVIASAAVFNNYTDRSIDQEMDRTKNRALVTGKISPRSALIYGSILGLVGISVLLAFVNVLTTCIALFGFISYVIVYGIAKRTSHWGAVVGSIPGAVPVVVGYTAITNHIDPAALILFLILVAWQMPHFYAIALYKMDEYRAAGVPVLPVQKGVHTTKLHIVSYIAVYIASTALLWVYGYTGYLYLIFSSLLGFVWFWKGMQGFTTKEDTIWAKRLFFSLLSCSSHFAYWFRLVQFCRTNYVITPSLPYFAGASIFILTLLGIVVAVRKRT